MEILVGAILVIVLAAAAVTAVRNVNANNAALGASQPSDVDRVMGLRYLGGHPMAPEPASSCRLAVTAHELAIEIQGRPMARMPLVQVRSVEIETGQVAVERLRAIGIVDLGSFSLAVPLRTSGPRSVLIVIETDHGPVIFERTGVDPPEMRGKMARVLAKIDKAIERRPAPPPPPAAEPVGSVADELEKLARLRDRGVLTDAEFQAQKRRLLDG